MVDDGARRALEEKQRSLLSAGIVRAEANFAADDAVELVDEQGQVFANASTFMQDYDLLLCPAAIIPAYPVEERYPGSSDGLAYSEYYRWLAICCAITTTTLPVITLPCGKTGQGLPVGLQLLGPALDEATPFRVAAAFQRLTDFHQQRPPEASA